ncbi:MAG: CDP-alcohol phosphatidyltransferase family protein [Clostridia bacterium]
MRYLPNIITCIRLILVPAFCYYLLKDNNTAAGIIFICAAISDVIDGYLARKFNWISNFGKLADPFADKIMQISAIIILCMQGKLMVWMMIAVFLKDSLLIIGALLVKFRYKFTVDAKWYGKAATVLLNLVIAVCVLFDPPLQLIGIIMIFTILFEYFALTMYSINFFSLLKKFNNEKRVA